MSGISCHLLPYCHSAVEERLMCQQQLGPSGPAADPSRQSLERTWGISVRHHGRTVCLTIIVLLAERVAMRCCETGAWVVCLLSWVLP
jgi:hypothetical protein